MSYFVRNTAFVPPLVYFRGNYLDSYTNVSFSTFFINPSQLFFGFRSCKLVKASSTEVMTGFTKGDKIVRFPEEVLVSLMGPKMVNDSSSFTTSVALRVMN